MATLGATAMLVVSAAPALAQHRDYHGRDYGHFSHDDQLRWRGGRWIHDWHDGRFGWWWFTDGYWYFYPQPIYPYPTYVPPVVEAPPPAPPPPAAASQYWYYCDNPAGYYPYVASCATPWRPVAPTPAPQPPQAAPPAPPPGAPPAPPPGAP
jgi:hypothetical protein